MGNRDPFEIFGVVAICVASITIIYGGMWRWIYKGRRPENMTKVDYAMQFALDMILFTMTAGHHRSDMMKSK